MKRGRKELVFHKATSRYHSVYIVFLIFVLCLPFLCEWEQRYIAFHASLDGV